MRRLIALVIVLLPLAACEGGPQSLGLTGPQRASPGPADMNDPFNNPDTLHSGTRYGPTASPTTGGGRFWGYD